MDKELKEDIKRAEQISEILYGESFQLSDIGLTSKTAFDWSKAGIYLRERKSKFRRKYNGIEYVWLRLVKELREFGLPISSILKLKEFLLQEMDLVKYYENLFDEYDLEGEELNIFLKDLSEAFNISEEANSNVGENKTPLCNTILSILVSSTIFGKCNAHLAVAKGGNCHVFEESPMKDLFVSSAIINEPYISMPLNYIISNFLWREELYDINVLEDEEELNEDEKKIIDLVRQGGINTIYIKFVDGSVNIIETEETVDIKETKGKLVDLIKRGGYEEISYKTEKGKIVSVKRTTKHKQ